MRWLHTDLLQISWSGLLFQYLPPVLAGVLLLVTLSLVWRNLKQRFASSTAPAQSSTVAVGPLRGSGLAVVPVFLLGLSFAGIGLVPQGRLLQLWLLERSYIPAQLILLAVVAFLTDRFLTATVDSIVTTLPGQAYARVATYLRAIKGVITSVIVIVTLLVAMTVVGLDILPILAGAGLLGLTLSLSAQSILRDVISGLLVLAEDQFRVSELIGINGTVGTVAEFSLRTTQLINDAGHRIMIPNSTISVVTNYSRGPVRTALGLSFAITSGFAAVKPLIEQSAATVLSKHQIDPMAAALDVGVSSIDATSYTVTVSLAVPGESAASIIRELQSAILVGLPSV